MKRLIFETIGLFLGFTLFIFVIGSLVGCTDNNIEAHTPTGESLGCDRFRVVEGNYDSEAILVDTETGVEYFWHRTGYAGGLTVIVDYQGKPLIAPGFKDYL